ncbi:WD40 repeat domain-containing protein [Tuwongella immobilis]|uniref:Serine-threonine kinase receptor-associated protein n=1 Tax=Tuwongella immobilis TaxID=692036 RepID=A0A6C2YI38_9BACT|nr:hypothetical protein [Tuwongella immobilis]VIP00929.1 wd40 repeat-containing protein : WD40 repeat-containing protein OS=Haliscomenobacter hydrossis (strain ATCC 27775 / DSM 1100 / LMG 10767 / O) GN=Halhy_6675 PE=4 SV=1 [Tuwongella immobilis]VTR97276.1 wd40 repeat-containing protein : WD40 repeat-containing protein OS=Haliscomenobacter hydrossis (strain ATCC 27775 / DSM 1100 / LMG 10767 / O) GN=Halhy_6675 PE=4 SV=1 [Tuwongella immobilis]
MLSQIMILCSILACSSSKEKDEIIVRREFGDSADIRLTIGIPFHCWVVTRPKKEKQWEYLLVNKTNHAVLRVLGEGSRYSDFKYLPQFPRLIQIINDTQVTIFDLKSNRDPVTFEIRNDGHQALWFMNGTKLVFAGADGTVEIHDYPSGKMLNRWVASDDKEGLGQMISFLEVSSDGNHLITGSGNDLRVWKIDTGELVHDFKVVRSARVYYFSPNKETIVALEWPEFIDICQLANGRSARISLRHRATCVKFSPDSKQFVVGTGDPYSIFAVYPLLRARGSVELFTIDPPTHKISRKRHSADVTKIEISPDQKTITTTDSQNQTIIHKLSDFYLVK